MYRESRASMCVRVREGASVGRPPEETTLNGDPDSGCKGYRGFVDNIVCFAPQEVFTLSKKALATSS